MCTYIHLHIYTYLSPYMEEYTNQRNLLQDMYTYVNLTVVINPSDWDNYCGLQQNY